ncbi:immediate early response 3-interacting protein 1-like [Gossypium australe]|uniref:Immediate early response 3-interacting protein 1-like n=11 Tax=Gossypium TaxID=3633 RepID=A0A5B6V2I7_9ROSI|nr:immediate early response 3-interacting protein 1-like [Gossypium australe]
MRFGYWLTMAANMFVLQRNNQLSQSAAPISSLLLHIRTHGSSPSKSNKKMGLWTILEGFLLLANALAILNEDRFLAPRGWSFSEFSAGRTKSFKGQLIGLIYATQYMRVPLILLNAICIFVKLVSG